MYDLHSHILPNIDDGAKNMEISLAMLRMAAENGTKGIVATPHVIEGEWLPAWDKILLKCELLRKTAQTYDLDLQIFTGGEVAIYRDILDLIKGPGAYCINGGRYLLVELPAYHIPSFTEDFFFTLQTRGITPILAHPERHLEISKKPELLAKWIHSGVLTQMNSTSITGLMGERVRRAAELLLMNHMVHVIGSDAHGIRNRHTNLRVAVDTMISLLGVEEVQRLLVINADHIIHSREVDIPECGDIEAFRGNSGVMHWFSKLWK